MGFKVAISDDARKAIKKLSHEAADRVLSYLEALEGTEDPRSKGKPLTGPLRGFWRYRVGDYRIVCEIHDGELLVVVVTIGHRRDVYR